MKTLKEQYESIQKWKKENVVRKEALIPKKDYEWFKMKLKSMGISYNRWVNQKIKEMEKLEKNLGGIKEMDKLPGVIFLVDPKKERIAILEAKKLGIPVVGLVDTNCNPEEVDYAIPGNDDAIRAVKLIADVMANAVIEGKQGESFEPEMEEQVSEVEEATSIEEVVENAEETEKEDKE